MCRKRRKRERGVWDRHTHSHLHILTQACLFTTMTCTAAVDVVFYDMDAMPSTAEALEALVAKCAQYNLRLSAIEVVTPTPTPTHPLIPFHFQACFVSWWRFASFPFPPISRKTTDIQFPFPPLKPGSGRTPNGLDCPRQRGSR